MKAPLTTILKSIRRAMKKHKQIILIIATLLYLIPSSMAVSEDLLIDKTVALVNDNMILMSELQEEVMIQSQRLDLTQLSDYEIEQIAMEILQNMINNYLLEEQADQEEIVISDEKIEQKLKEQIDFFKSNFESETEFQGYLASHNTTEFELKKRYRELIERELKISKLIQMKLLPKVNITEDEIASFYEENKSELEESLTISLSGLKIPKLPSGENLSNLMNQFREYRKRALEGENFGELARKYSEAPDAKVGGLTAYFGRGEMLPEFEEVAFNLELGEISQPFLSSYGVHIIKLESRKEDQIRVRHITVPLQLKESEIKNIIEAASTAYNSLLLKESLQSIKDTISSKYDLECEIISLDSVTEDKLSTDYPALLPAIKEIEEGEISTPVEGSEAYYVIKVESKSGGETMSLNEARKYIKRILTNQEVEDLQSKWLEKLRDKAYIEIYSE